MSATGYLNLVLALATPSADDRSKASQHRVRIEEQLQGDLGVYRIFETGSWSHGTATVPWSDVDYFASMPGSRSSTSFGDLERLRSSLVRVFRDARVRINRPSVGLHFSSGPDVEIVPAHITSDNDYFIPDPDGIGWVKSSPLKHRDYVNKARDSEPSAKSFIRLLKEWKYQNDVPIPSLYLEMRGAQHVLAHPPFIMLWDLALFFENLDRNGLRDMNDPSKSDVGRRIPALTSASDSSFAARAVVLAAKGARLAKDLSDSGNHAQAEAALRVLFSPRAG